MTSYRKFAILLSCLAIPIMLVWLPLVFIMHPVNVYKNLCNRKGLALLIKFYNDWLWNSYRRWVTLRLRRQGKVALEA